MITRDHLDIWFTYHPPKEEDVKKYTEIRSAARHFAGILIANTPPGADQSAAMRKLRECVMTANAAIACHEDA